MRFTRWTDFSTKKVLYKFNTSNFQVDCTDSVTVIAITLYSITRSFFAHTWKGENDVLNDLSLTVLASSWLMVHWSFDFYESKPCDQYPSGKQPWPELLRGKRIDPRKSIRYLVTGSIFCEFRLFSEPITVGVMFPYFPNGVR